MATFTFKSVPLDSVEFSGPDWDRFLCRYRIDAADLVDSIHSAGVVEPITVEECAAGRYRVIAGFRRVAAAREAGMTEAPAVVYPKDSLSQRQAFSLALAANAPGATLSDADRATALSKAASAFGFDENALIDTVAPLLGLPASHKVVRQYIAIAESGEAVMEALCLRRISKEHALAVALLPGDDREWFFEKLVAALRLSAGDARLAAAGAIDLASRSGATPREALEEILAGLEGIAEVAPDAGKPHAVKAGLKAAFKDALARKLRPMLTKMTDEFEQLANDIAAAPGVFEHSPNFERDEVIVRLTAKSLGDLEALKTALERGLASGAFERMLDLAARQRERISRGLDKPKSANSDTDRR